MSTAPIASTSPSDSGDSVVFIDSRISSLELVVAGLAAGTRWVIVNSERDGLTQIAAALQGASNLQSIQVLSHGGPGSLLLGSGSITSGTLQSQAVLLASIGAALAPEGDLLLYGCNVAQGDSGAQFIALLAQLTGADVAASTDLTGDASLGGDWVLEANTGAIEATALSLDGLIGTLDTINGTAGDDSLVGTTNDDTLSGLDGNDTLLGEFGSDSLVGGLGDDRLEGNLGNDTLEGGDGIDYLTDNQGTNYLDGGSGNDNLNTTGLTSQNTLLGGSGEDALSASGQSAYLDGGDDVDQLSVNGLYYNSATYTTTYVQRGTATLIGGSGDDNSMGMGGLSAAYLENALLQGGDGSDRLQIHSTRNATLEGGAGQDTLTSTNFLDGGSADQIGASHGTRYRFDGGADNDTLSISGYSQAWGGLVDLTLEGGLGDDSLSVADIAASSNYSAIAYAILSGGDGNDTLTTSGVLQLTLTGGAGTDTFALTGIQQRATQRSFSFTTATSPTHTTVSVVGKPIVITDFNAGAGGDVIDLSDLLVTATFAYDGSNPFGSSGYLYLQQSFTNPADAVLLFDADGVVGSAATWVPIAILNGVSVSALTPENFSPLFASIVSPLPSPPPPGTNIVGTEQPDTLTGGAGGDTINGLGGNDSLVGNDGNDSIDGGYGNDTLEGGAGDDTLLDVQGINSLDGGSGSDSISIQISPTYSATAAAANSLIGGAGNDTLNGVAQTLYLEGGDGSDRLIASGNYSIIQPYYTSYSYWTSASATLLGGAGDDSGSGTAGGLTASYLDRALLQGGDGQDRLEISNTRHATLEGGIGQDTLIATAFLSDSVAGQIGSARGTSYRFDGGADNDVLSISGSANSFNGIVELSLEGGSGNDVLTATDSANSSSSGAIAYATLSGGDGNDTLNASGVLQLTLTGGLGVDTFVLSNSQRRAGQSTHTFTTSSPTNVSAVTNTNVSGRPVVITDFTAGAGGDVLDLSDLFANGAIGFDGSNPFGASGYLRLVQTTNSPANSLLMFDADGGGNSFQVLALLNTVDPSALTASNFSPAFTSFAIPAPPTAGETLIGTDTADSLYGSFTNDSIDGAGGNDRLEGNDGNDTLLGGAGNDSLFGGAGDDSLIGGGDTFSTLNQYFPGSGSDTIDGGTQINVPWPLTGSLSRDRIDYSATAGVTINLTNRTVSVNGESGVDTYSGIESIYGALNGSDRVTGRVTDNVGEISAQGNSLFLRLNGGSDQVSLEPYGKQQIGTDGVYLDYSWSKTGISLHYTNGNTAEVDYGALDTQLAGTDTLVGATMVYDSPYNDVFDFSGQKANHLGYRTTPYDDAAWSIAFLTSGGSDRVIGNGSTIIYLPVNLPGGSDSIYGYVTRGARIDLTTGTADLSLLPALSTGRGFGTLNFSGVNYIMGTNLGDTLLGGAFEFEAFRGQAGNDFINGREGHDRADYSSIYEGMTFNLASGLVTSSILGSDTLRGIEDIRGTRGNDTFDATGFEGGYFSNISNVGSYWWGFNAFLENGGSDRIIGNGATRVDYARSMVAVQADLGTGVVDARVEADKATPLYATLGQDTLSGVFDLRGSMFDDLLEGGGTGITTLGMAFERFVGNAGDDTIDGRAGIDEAAYLTSPDAIEVDMRLATGQVIRDGWGFTDTLTSIEIISGGAFDDRITGSNLADSRLRVEGSKGNDTIYGGAGHTQLSYLDDDAGVEVRLAGWVGPSGALTAGFSGSARDGWSTIDVFRDIDGIVGSDFNDTLVGDAFDNSLDGAGGSDWIDGGAGTDTLRFDRAMQGVHVDLGAGRVYDDGQGTGDERQQMGTEQDTVLGIENVVGGFGHDNLTGDSLANLLQGAEGHDTLLGGLGQDTLSGGAGDDLLDGQDGVDTAIFTGLRNDYTLTDLLDGGVRVTDNRNSTVSGFDGVDILHGIERMQFADTVLGLPEPPLPPAPQEHLAYHWKGHMLLAGVQVGTMTGDAVQAESSIFDLRGASYDSTTGMLTVQLWSTPASTSTSIDFTVSSPGSVSAGFVSALPASWAVLINSESTQALSVAGYDGALAGFSGATQLGTLTVQYAPGTSAGSVTLSNIFVDIASASDTVISFSGATTGSNGSFTLADDGAASTALSVSRSTSDIGNAITAADALAALRLAVGLNPNIDPDGAGPLSAPRVSPYQFMAADVNGSNTVTAADALAILRMAVKLSTALPNEWFFVEETRDFWDEATQSFTLTRTNTTWDRSVTVDASASPAVNVVGVLKGDVNGSWAAPAGSIDLDTLDPNYFTNLATRLGVMNGATPVTDQWGV